MNDIRNLFSNILDSYAAPDRKKFESANPVWQNFERLKEKLSAAEVFQKRPDMAVKMSVGIGNWAEIPWICFFPPHLKGPKEGIYPGILFRADMSGFYLFVGQGVVKLYENLGRHQAEAKLQETAYRARSYISSEQSNLDIDVTAPMELRAEGDLGAQYEQGYIICKLYERDNLPNDADFLNDVDNYIKAYEIIESREKLITTSTKIPHYWVGHLDSASFYTGNAKESKESQPWRKYRLVKWGRADGRDKEFTETVNIGDFFSILGYTGIHTQANHYCSGIVIDKSSEGSVTIEIWNPELRGNVNFSVEGTGKRLIQIDDPGLQNNVFGDDFLSRRPQYWAGGHAWGKESQKDRFIANQIWEYGFEPDATGKGAKHTFKYFPTIKRDDYFAIKGYGGSNVLKIYAVGRVMEIFPEKNQITYEPLDIELFHGKAPKLAREIWNDTLVSVTGEQAITAVFGGKTSNQTKDQPMANDVLSDLNLIIYGPPGTGKTYRLQKEYFPLFSDGQEKRYVFVTFHQSYGYEEFIEGLRPVVTGNQMTYAVVPGAFKTIAKRADEDPDHSYAIFIDEINRGNISKIFGELLTLIEPDKRKQPGKDAPISVTLPYSGEQFSVPSNLYVVGTMNTADRSIALLDTALRRRFSFVEIMPEYELPELNREIEGIHLGRLLKDINRRIEYLYDREHVIGHAYLTKVSKLDDLCHVFKRNIIPLLQEYFFEDWEKTCQVLNCSADQETKNNYPIIYFDELPEIGTAPNRIDKKFSYQVNPEFRMGTRNLKEYFEGLLD